MHPFLVLVLLLFAVAAAAARAHGDGVFCRRCGASITKLSHLLPALPKHVGHEHVHADFNKTVGVVNDLHQEFNLAVFSTATCKPVPTAQGGASPVDNSFFPGNAWHNVECGTCGSFLGWGFDRLPSMAAETGKEVQACSPTLQQALAEDFPSGRNCLTKQMRGAYWTVEFCYGARVMQYHLAPRNLREPEYSLGVYDEAIGSIMQELDDGLVFHLLPGTLGPRKFLRQEYVNGQPCDETGAGRRTKVVIACCINYHKSLGPLHAPFIADFKEPSTCQYEIIVCSPALCKVAGFSPIPPQVVLEVCPATPAVQTEEPKEALPPSRFYALDVDNAVVSESSADLLWSASVKPTLGGM